MIEAPEKSAEHAFSVDRVGRKPGRELLAQSEMSAQRQGEQEIGGTPQNICKE